MEAEVFKKELERISGEAQKQLGAIREELRRAQAGNASSETVKDLQHAYEQLKETMKEQGMQLRAGYETGRGIDPKEVAVNSLNEALKTQAEAIKGAVSGPPVRLALKAAETIGSANFGVGVLQGLRMAAVDAMDRNPYFIMNEITVINGGPGSDPFSVIERVAKEGGAANVAENALKPFYDFTYTEKKVNAETIAAIVPVNKQALLKMPLLRSHILEELVAELEEELQKQIILGNGTPPNLTGIKQVATAFNAGGLADQITDANEYDVIRAVAAQVYRNKGRAGVVMVHPDKIALMDLKKGEDGHYIVPPFTSADGTVVAGVRVRESFELGADEFLGGDLKKYLFNIVEDITIEVGLINDQFQRNQLSVRAEIMGAGLVKAQHTNKLIKGDFTLAKALLQV